MTGNLRYDRLTSELIGCRVEIMNLFLPQPPIIPKIFYAGDTQNFESYPDTWDMKSITEEELEMFEDF